MLWNCQGSHFLPTGHKCIAQILAETINDYWEKHLDPSDVTIELWSSEWTALKKEEDSYSDYECLEMSDQSPSNYQAWPQRSGHKPKEDSTRSHFQDSHGESDYRHREEEVAILREDVARLRDETKSIKYQNKSCQERHLVVR